MVNRENRDQSLELRDLKKANSASQERNNQLREQNSQLREAIRAGGEKLGKSEKSKYNEHFEHLEEMISRLHYERQKREAHMEFLTEQTREANEGKASVESESRKLQRQVRDLSTNLTECKDDLLRLQPTSQVSDNEISDQYSNLDQQISGWVDDKTEDSQTLEDNIDKVKTIEDLPDLLRVYLSSDQLKMAKKYPDAQPILIRYLIYRFLGSFVLDDDIYLFGLDSRYVALLKGLEEGMKLLEPRRGKQLILRICATNSQALTLADDLTLRRWRSETLQSLLKMDTFIEEQESQAQLVSQTLHSALSHLMSNSLNSDESWEDLHNQIILPAIQLSTKLRLSTADYRLTSHIFHRDPSQSAASVFVFEIKSATMIDITTHKVIRPDSVLKVADDGRIGEEKLVVSPALLRLHRVGKGKVLVCKPTMLVKLDEPMGKRSRGIKALGAWTPSWFGGDEATT